ncbi:MAG: hypothetical protein JXB62_21590 [Pirellulales bacterium]|nr:hypothetical protein [Pirellulales bacterium]
MRVSQLAAVMLPCLWALGQGERSARAEPAEEAAAPTEATAAPMPEEIARAVGQLGDECYGVRQQASEYLWQAGRAAEPALGRALQSHDPEVVARARRILRSFHYGVYPETPPEVVALIGQYRYGSQAVRLGVLKRLRDMEQMTTLLLLLKKEPDEETRKKLAVGLLKGLDRVAGRMFLDGAWEKVEQLLELGAVSEEGMRNYAAYLLLRGQLDAGIAAQTKEAELGQRAVDWQLLAYLLRARGDLSGAKAAAERATDETLLSGLLVELGDWQPLADSYDKLGRDTQGQLAGGIVHFGYTAAYHRLAGQTQGFEDAVAGIKQLAEAKPNKLRYCAEALLINGRFRDAVEICARQEPALAFEVLCLQARYGEALALAGLGDPQGLDGPWFDDETPQTRNSQARRRERFLMGLRVAGALRRLGEADRAGRLLEQLAVVAGADGNLSPLWVCRAELDLGFTQQAFRHVANALANEGITPVLRTLFPREAREAELWWKLLCDQVPKQSPADMLGTLHAVLRPVSAENQTVETLSAEDWTRLAQQAAKAAEALSPDNRGRWLANLGEICIARSDRVAARSFLEKAASAAPSAAVWMQLGDLLAAEGQWSQAAAWYRQVWATEPTGCLALYLQGHALVQAGQDAEGRQLIEAARLLPLGNAETRFRLASGLQQRGLVEEARRQWELILRTGELQSAGLVQAAEQHGNALKGKDDLKAAAYNRWALLRSLRTSRPDLGAEGYLQRVHRIHLLRARGLLADGQVDEALREIDLCHAALPGEISLALELVPLLEKAGHLAEADALFDRAFAANTRVCEEFPNAAACHHNAASLATRCHRRLDEGLTHAERAAALAPGDAAYRDTLAEIRTGVDRRRKTPMQSTRTP